MRKSIVHKLALTFCDGSLAHRLLARTGRDGIQRDECRGTRDAIRGWG